MSTKHTHPTTPTKPVVKIFESHHWSQWLFECLRLVAAFISLNPLFSIAKELQSFGKEKAGIQFRFGRQDADKKPKAITDLLEEGHEKGAGNLETLTEERNGYYKRKKTGFSIWFGRRNGEAFCAKGSFSGAPTI
uniref:Uncharacterized protein n=1 Tax=Naja naja TaxID=35670 RepID=A0A8C6YBW5_NAJNA